MDNSMWVVFRSVALSLVALLGLALFMGLDIMPESLTVTRGFFPQMDDQGLAVGFGLIAFMAVFCLVRDLCSGLLTNFFKWKK